MKMLYPDYVFICKKCMHLLYTTKTEKLIGLDCPNCGEEWFENWIFKRMGNFELEYEQKTKNN